MAFLWVAIGGAMGALARFGVSELVAKVIGRGWVPAATLLVNVVGCLVIGYVARRHAEGDVAWLIANRPLVVAGVCGGLTTFSTFGLEVVELLATKPILAIALVLAHVGGGLGAVWLGMKLGG
ncbi:MAG: CrcB family protein [Planctomycetota bacterium]